MREIQGEDLGFDFAGDAAEVPVLDVATDVDAAGGVLVLDHVGRGDDAEIGDVAQGDVGAGRRIDAKFAEGFGIGAEAWLAPDGDVEYLLILVDFADLGSAEESDGGAANIAAGEAEAGGGVLADDDLNLRKRTCGSTCRVATPGMSLMAAATICACC